MDSVPGSDSVRTSESIARKQTKGRLIKVEELIENITSELAAAGESLGVVLSKLPALREQLDPDNENRDKINAWTAKLATIISDLDDIASELEEE